MPLPSKDVTGYVPANQIFGVMTPCPYTTPHVVSRAWDSDWNSGACCSYIVTGRVFRRRRQNGVSDKAQDCTKPQQQRETAEQQFTELDPLWDGLGRTQLV